MMHVTVWFEQEYALSSEKDAPTQSASARDTATREQAHSQAESKSQSQAVIKWVPSGWKIMKIDQFWASTANTKRVM